ncbi:MAG: hypothetical protein ACTSW1_13610 [Candidatus Hodarchaeales archaeon]
MQRADPKNMTEADIRRAKRNVDKTRALLKKGKTPGQLIMELAKLISTRNNTEDK